MDENLTLINSERKDRLRKAYDLIKSVYLDIKELEKNGLDIWETSDYNYYSCIDTALDSLRKPVQENEMYWKL